MGGKKTKKMLTSTPRLLPSTEYAFYNAKIPFFILLFDTLISRGQYRARVASGPRLSSLQGRGPLGPEAPGIAGVATPVVTPLGSYPQASCPSVREGVAIPMPPAPV